jgi:predicted negative regulator of RcsB-dependent stress response
MDDMTALLKRTRGTNRLLSIVVVLLLLLVAAQGYTIFTSYQQQQIVAARAATYAERVKAVESVAATQRDVINQLTDRYRKAAYQDTSIDRIAEQQLLAAEYEMQGLQILGIQNSEIIERQRCASWLCPGFPARATRPYRRPAPACEPGRA